MRLILAALSALALSGMIAAASPTQALAKSDNYYYGRVTHVSTQNMKVYSYSEKRAISFLLVPKFKNVFSEDGKTTYEMAKLRPGTFVKILYTQKLGLRHADSIFILDPKGKAVKAMLHG